MVKIEADVPKEMRSYAESASAKEKPYDICLRCPFFSVTCDGPNVLAMEYKRWVEWCWERIKLLGLTLKEVAFAAGLPLSTVKSALDGGHYDARADTVRRITKALIGGCWGQFPCHLAALLMEGAAQEAEPDTVTATERQQHEAQIKEIKADYQAKVDYLKEQVEHWKQESKIRDKYLAEKNEYINKLMDRILEK